MTPLENTSSVDDGGTTTTTSTIIMENNNTNTDNDTNAITEQQHQHQHQPVTTTTTTTTTSSTLSSTSSTSSSPVLVNVLNDDDDEEDDDNDDSNNILGQGKVKHENDPLSSSLLPLVPQTDSVDNNNNNNNNLPHDSGVGAATATTTMTKQRIQQFIFYIWKQYIHQIVGKIRSLIQLYDRNCSSISNSIDSTTITTTTLRSLSVSSLLYQSIQKCINFYNQFIMKPSNQDKILKLLQYTFYMISISIVSNHQNNNTTSNTNNNNNHNNKTLFISKWLYKLYTEFTWARYVLRILQLPIAIDAAINHSWTIQAIKSSSSNDNDTTTAKVSSLISSLLSCIDPNQQRQTIYNLFGNIMSYSMVLYYPTELMAYLLWMKPSTVPLPSTSSTTSSSTSTATTLQYHPYEECSNVTTTTSTITTPLMKYRMLFTHMYRTFYSTKLLQQQQQQSKNNNNKNILSSLLSKFSNIPPETWSYISSRCWLTYIITELIQCIVQYNELNNQISSVLSKQNSIEDKDGTTVTTIDKHQQQKQQIVLQSIRNILFLIPCMTWSLSDWDTKPIVSLRTVNTLLWFESIVSIYQAIIIQIHSK